MTRHAKEFAAQWADTNIQPDPTLSDEQVMAKVQEMLSAATGAHIPPKDIVEAVGSAFDFISARAGRDPFVQ